MTRSLRKKSKMNQKELEKNKLEHMKLVKRSYNNKQIRKMRIRIGKPPYEFFDNHKEFWYTTPEM